MRQAIASVPFVANIVARPASGLAGRWSALADEQPIAKPAIRRGAGVGSKLWLNAVRALDGLVAGTTAVRYVSQSDPALVGDVKIQGSVESFCYRTRSNQVYTTGPMQQSPDACALFAVRLLANRAADFSAAYLALLSGIAANKPQPDLDGLMATAADELLYACQEDLGLDATPQCDTVWFYSVRPTADDAVHEYTEAGALSLTPLLTDPSIFEKYLKGEPTPFVVVEKIPGTNATISTTPVDLDSDSFIGPQLAIIVKYAQKPRTHILYYGPTGTGKSFVWEKGMIELNRIASDAEVAAGREPLPPFDANEYPYFVQGSGGLEDIDFTGQAILDKEGNRHWVDGPLTRAMQDGKRFKCEELNRLPGSMLNVLLGAMDYGRIYIPALGKMVVAAPGFAVDAMANIGREYTATEDIDPAVMRRFQIKVSFDFLPADQEVKLLRSRYRKLRPEDAETLVRIANTIREAHENGSGSVDVDLYVSPAALLNCAELVAEGVPMLEAVELTWLADVAWTKAKRESVKGVLDLHIKKKPAKVKP
jgi:MoxR-like ATPase